MNRIDLIKKVQALRALANDSASTLEEAATAARVAELLIQKNKLDEAEFEITNGSQESVIEDDDPVVIWGQRQTVWQNILLTSLAKAYGCEGVLTWVGGKMAYKAIGRPSDISTMRYQFAYLHLELTRLAGMLAPNDLQRGSGKKWYNSFYLGAVSAINKAMTKTQEEVRSTANQEALVIIDRHADEAEDLLHKLHPNMRTVKRKSRIDRDAWNAGNQAGSGLNAKPAINSGFRGLLGQ